MKKLSLPSIAVSLPAAFIVAGILIGVNELGYQRSTEVTRLIARDVDMQNAVERLMRTVLDAETGQRGYLLTGNEKYLAPYELAVLDIKNNLNSVRAFYIGQPELLGELGNLSAQVWRKMTELDLTLQLRKSGRTEASLFVLTTDIGKQHMDAIRTQADAMLSANNDRVNAAKQSMAESLQFSRIAVTAAVVLALAAFYLYLRQTAALAQAGLREQESLKKERDMLDDQVRERTARLAELATHLQLVREEEREHLARELHDELGSLLTAAKLDVARLKSRIAPDASEALERLRHLTETLNHGIALKRRIIENLRPSALTNLGLVEALDILAREFAQGSGLEVVTDLEAVDIDETKQLCIYRLVQESLTNIAKYAQAKKIHISLHNHRAHVEVHVRDDGKGFEPAQQNPSSHGLAGMRHRIEAARGRFMVHTAPGQGTHIEAVIPNAYADTLRDKPELTS